MEQIMIEVAYATPEKQVIIPLTIDINTSIAKAVSLSGVSNIFPELKASEDDYIDFPIGIFGKKINPATYTLQAQDRIEIYRPLNKTPNQKRIDRAKNNAK
jgi:putative ubiquitin-RnfH superfamily antitoxin RatB of RatAB toxin-antitoxin module